MKSSNKGQKAKQENVIELPEDITIDMGDKQIILEKGDYVKVLETVSYGRQISPLPSLSPEEFNSKMKEYNVRSVDIHKGFPIGKNLGSYYEQQVGNIEVSLMNKSIVVSTPTEQETFKFKETPTIEFHDHGMYGYAYRLFVPGDIYGENIEASIHVDQGGMRVQEKVGSTAMGFSEKSGAMLEGAMVELEDGEHFVIY